VNLQSFWNGLLGGGITPYDIRKDVREIERVKKEKESEIKNPAYRPLK
jgi:hypothetical protein